VNTAELRVAKKLSVRHDRPEVLLTDELGCSRTASEIEQKMTPALASLSLKVVATDTLSKTASTATPASIFCSSRGMPSFS
jgi:hypothetical protein